METAGTAHGPVAEPQPEGASALGSAPDRLRRRRGTQRLFAAVFLGVLVLASTGVVIAVRGIVATRSQPPRNDASSQRLTDSERALIGASADADTLWDAGAARAFAGFLDRRLPGVPSDFLEITLFGDYAFAVARDVADPSRVVQGEWRGDEMYLFRSMALAAGGEPPSFTVAQVPWDRLGSLMDTAAERLAVRDPVIRYLQITADPRSASGVVMHFFVSSDTDEGGVLVADGSGSIVRIIRDTSSQRMP